MHVLEKTFLQDFRENSEADASDFQECLEEMFYPNLW